MASERRRRNLQSLVGRSSSAVKGTQPGTPPPPPPTPLPRPVEKWLVLALAAIIIVAIAALTISSLPGPPPIPLTVSDGSTTGTIEGNLTTVGSNQTDLVLDFAASTYASQTDGLGSTLTLRLHTYSLYDSACGCLETDVIASVVGSFAANLRPSALQFVVNQSGPRTETQGWGAGQGTNVSIDPAQILAFANNGTGALTATIVSQPGVRYSFTYSEKTDVRANETPSVRYNHFLGFRVIVTGAFTPSVSVGILLKIVDASGGIWT